MSLIEERELCFTVYIYENKYLECSQELSWFRKVAVVSSPRRSLASLTLDEVRVPGRMSFLSSEP